jgi:hypothetical protein
MKALREIPNVYENYYASSFSMKGWFCYETN